MKVRKKRQSAIRFVFIQLVRLRMCAMLIKRCNVHFYRILGISNSPEVQIIMGQALTILDS